jgi:hypothetical protein
MHLSTPGPILKPRRFFALLVFTLGVFLHKIPVENVLDYHYTYVFGWFLKGLTNEI